MVGESYVCVMVISLIKMTHVHESHPCFLHVLFLLHPPGLLDILEAGSLDDGECDEDHVGVGVGEGPHVFIVLLARRVANPGHTVTYSVFKCTLAICYF